MEALMGWQDLLQREDETVVLPWVGGRSLTNGKRFWRLTQQPPEPGWHLFSISGRTAKWVEPADQDSTVFESEINGYLVGNRLIPDTQGVVEVQTVVEQSVRLYLADPGIDRFSRVVGGRIGDRVFYSSLDMPLGPEPDVLQAFLDRKESVADISGVTPALDVAFRLESWYRVQGELRRAEAERKRREEDERLRKEELRQQLVERLGDGAGRREMARVDFGEAARSALAVGGATYLDHRNTFHANEIAVRFRLLGQRFECTCDRRTLQIIDAGVCLTDHATGYKWDTHLTLESLPPVIAEAERTHQLVVFRHA